MVDEFSAFARMPEAAPEMADLSDTIRQAVFLEGVRLPEIHIVTDIPPEAIHAHFDSRLISQCLTNLIKNAVEAFESDGITTIQNPTITVQAAIEGKFVRVTVSDNGKGWPKDNRQRLLEPYMTTREKGTGLGLAIVAKIVEQHGGQVELLDSEPDANGRVGASFAFTLPLQSPANSNDVADEAAGPSGDPHSQEEPQLNAVVHN
jgi:two-component system nitrogen regulation sensor histidine kinase NtrY